jgi:hypothetical protein
VKPLFRACQEVLGDMLIIIRARSAPRARQEQALLRPLPSPRVNHARACRLRSMLPARKTRILCQVSRKRLPPGQYEIIRLAYAFNPFRLETETNR